MKNLGKFLVEKLSSIKKAVYIPIAVAGLSLMSYIPSYAQATRTTETETFNDGTVSKSTIEEHPEKWDLINAGLEAKDFEGLSGDTRYLFNDKLYNYKTTNLCIEVELNRTAWPFSDRAGIVVCGDPTQGAKGTYYEFAIRADPTREIQIYTLRNTPGFDSQVYFSTQDSISREKNMPVINSIIDKINKNEFNKLTVSYKSGKYNFLINDLKIDTTIENVDQETGEITIIDLADGIPLLEGYVGDTNTDSTEINDPLLTTLTRFDNYKFVYDAGTGAGAGLEDKLIAHNPEVFIRGDSNGDNKLDISDPVATLYHIFLGNNNYRCGDAMDANDDGQLDISDPIYTLLHLFVDAKQFKILPPNIGGRGMDLTYDNLNCPDRLLNPEG